MELEADIKSVRAAIATAFTQEQSLRSEADKVRADLREAGVDFSKDKDAFEKIDVAYRDADEKRDEITDLKSREARLMEIAGEVAVDRTPSADREFARSTVAERLLCSEPYKALRASGVLNQDGVNVRTNPVEVATRDELRDMLRQRTTVDNTSGSGGGVIWSDRLEDLIVPIPKRMIRLLDLVTVGSTDTDTIEWVDETTVTDAAAETAYGSNAPEAAYGYTKASTTVKRITHFVPATKGAISDSGQLQTLLESRLNRGVRFRLENQVFSGDGTGENLSGFAKAGVVTNTVAKGSNSYFDTVHKGITQVRTTYFDEPTAIGIHPVDFESVLLEKDANGNYVHGRAASEGTVTTIWGLNPVVSTVFAQGSPWVADFSQFYLWLREGLSLAMSDSHASFFIQGLVAILAQMRAGGATVQPLAFCALTGF